MSDPQPWTARRYAVIDVEGNGQHPPDLVELAVVHVVDGIIGEPTAWLVRPDTPILWQARRVHGISNDDVATAESFDAVRADVLAHLGDAVIVGHNVGIDLDVLRRKLPDWRPAKVIDTLRIARRLLPDLGTHRLGALVDHLDLATGLPDGLQPHRAAYDVLVTARLLRALATTVAGLTTWDALCELGGPPRMPAPDDATDRLF